PGAVPAAGAGAGIEWVGADPQDTPALAAASRGATVVVQALSPVYTHKAWRRDVPRLTDAAIAIGRELGATLMLPASVYNFGEQLPPELREDTAQSANTVKGRLRIQSERRIAQATADGRMNAVVIRGGDFFGSGRGSWVDQLMVKDLRSGKFSYPGPLDRQHAWAYLPDMAQAFVRVAAKRERLPAFREMHFGGHSVTGQDWADALGQIARELGWLSQGRPLKHGSLPWPLLRALGAFAPTFEALSEMRYLWLRPHRLVNTRMQALVGPEQHTPFAAAVRAALADLGFLKAPAPPAAHPTAATAG
ncbi:MAG: epimerase, partial [Pseudomonadota bacterium]|nr:epimerase [Pseudomonadota bacterium]